MKILLINPPYSRLRLTKECTEMVAPLGLAYLAAAAHASIRAVVTAVVGASGVGGTLARIDALLFISPVAYFFKTFIL